ncbi:FMN-binding protein [Paenarthrobacter nitroguajacolicus]|uniref:FMN-binding protein n=1 Tax=Paenarthrobacter nitroguajacolicus TaxID=211146 RepID=UPI004053850D
MTTPLRKSLYVGFAGLSIIGTAAACAPTAGAPTTQTPATQDGGQAGTSSPSSANTSSSAPVASTGASTYKDGTYSSDGTYTSPNGQETVGVELTLAADKVSAVNITVHPSNPNTKKFQGEFAGGIAAQIVGKDIDELNVSKVAGSSLTSGGFNEAVEQIKSQAK